jgi:hypothetical protein
VGRSFDIARPNYVVLDYHIELLQMKTVLELANLSISFYSCTLDDSYSLLKPDAADYNLQFFLFGSMQRAFTNRSHVGLFSQRDGYLS